MADKEKKQTKKEPRVFVAIPTSREKREKLQEWCDKNRTNVALLLRDLVKKETSIEL